MRKHLYLALTLAFIPLILNAQQHTVINLFYTSDAHYGLSRDHFRGDTAVPAQKVNEAMIEAMNSMVGQRLPDDAGVGANQVLQQVGYLIQSGDIANRQEPPYQSATQSWNQFIADYSNGSTFNDTKPTLLLVPGNHDISNAIGFTKKMVPATDPTVMVEVYNRMMSPQTPLTNSAFELDKDKINYSREIGGVHFMFLTLWPDSAERIWMEQDLKNVAPQTPVVIFTHDQPTAEPKHFSNPVTHGKFTSDSKFENLVAEEYKESIDVRKDEASTDIEQRGFVAFLKKHPNIKVYFHGNSNWNEFYQYHGPDNDINLPIFRVDSPMKGKFSAKDETRLSFQLISLDPSTQKITVREILWNKSPKALTHSIAFGGSKTINLAM